MEKHSFLFRVYFKLNIILTGRLFILNFLGLNLSVIDKFLTPGDTVLTAIVCRNIKMKYPRIKINCITPNPDLLELDPNIDHLNRPETFLSVPVWYVSIKDAKDPCTNVLKPTFDLLGMKGYEYRAGIYLSSEEKRIAGERLRDLSGPIIAISAMSRQEVKVWSAANWQKLVEGLSKKYSVVQLGDEKEPYLKGVTRFAGRLSFRESMAVLSFAKLYIGPDSFLMHAANGLNVPSVIIFGGQATPDNLGYKENVNIYMKTECSPCWIRNTAGETCPYGVKCMKMITPEMVRDAVMALLPGHKQAV